MAHSPRQRVFAFTALAAVLLALALTRWLITPAPTPELPSASSYRININTAPRAELQLLPGVGPALADRIIAARTEKPFTTPEDLRRVNGIGPKLAPRIAPYIQFTNNALAPVDTPH
ncbi:helix-hairpin-helix domain-containing protein [Planctomycetales bacterium ZRK34]|nr:helix-hairpin-helix domain-containing protein [Planctomycetales bacterium ZRK34]